MQNLQIQCLHQMDLKIMYVILQPTTNYLYTEFCLMTYDLLIHCSTDLSDDLKQLLHNDAHFRTVPRISCAFHAK